HLGRIPLFRGLSTSQLEDLNRKLTPEVFRRGEVICREGEEADRMWFIEAGQAEVVVLVDGEEVPLATLRDGDFFGEMALLTGSVRSATVRAATDLELWSLRKEDFDGLLLQYPTVAIALSQALSERLHATTERLTQIALTRQGARRVPASLPERRVSPVAPTARPVRRPTPAFGLQRSVLGALQRLQQMAQDTAAWFGECSAATKLRLAAVLLLLAWLCGISVPAMLVSSLSARTVQAQNAARLALTQTPPLVAPAPVNAPAVAEAPVAMAAPMAQAQTPEVQAPVPQVEEPVVVIGGGKPEAPEAVAPAPTEAQPTPTSEVAPFCVVTSETLNVRSGPGVVYDRIGQVLQGEQYEILAASGTGWYLIDFGGREGWVSEDYVEVRGAAERIALAEVIPPTPTPVPPTATPQPQPTEPALMAAAAPALPPRKWDGRLDLLGVRVEPAAAAPGQLYWRLVEARWANEQESQGKHHIYVNVLDENGQRIIGQPVVVRWHDGQVVIKTEDKPEPEFSCNFQMYTVLGAYDLYVDGLPSDKVLGMGLGTPELPNWTIHTSFYLVFQRTTG
ncbi:MAG: cyclic nucleotide-binding domain-containing protein, partial [Anaerolineae bacterium]